MRLNYLSTNLIGAINRILTDDDLCKLLYYSESDPYSQSAIEDKTVLLFDKINPYPFSDFTVDDIGLKLYMYYADGEFKGSQVIEDHSFFIDIVYTKEKENVLITDEGKPLIRPYEALSRITTVLQNDFRFESFVNIHINASLSCIRIIANTWSIGN